MTNLYDPSRRYDNEQRNRRSTGAVDYVVMVITVILCILLALSYLAPFVRPDIVWPFALLGLGFSVMYILCIMLFLYWVIRWRRFALVPMFTLLLGLGLTPWVVRPQLSKDYAPADKNVLKVFTYNVRGLIDFDPDGNSFSTATQVMELVRQSGPDIVCFQEFQTTPWMDQNDIDGMLEGMPYKKINYKLPGEDGIGWGTAVYSRYPIVGSGEVEFKSTSAAQWVDIVIKRDTVRVFNAHLQSFLLTASDKDFINQELLGSETELKIRSIVGKLKRGYITRVAQADTLSARIKESPYETIVCGDFNDTPVSYVYRTLRGGMHDSFVEKGRGFTNNTYRGFFDLFRIDYILHSGGYKAMSYEVMDSDLSDHNPVIVSLKKL